MSALALPLLWMLGIFLLSSIPGGEKDVLGYRFTIQAALGNALHVPLYFGLGLCWMAALASRAKPWLRAALLAVVLSVAFGVLDEIHQSFVPRRTASVFDVVLDFAGAATAALAWPILARIFGARRGTGGE